MTSSEESYLARLEATIAGIERAARESQRELDQALSGRAGAARRGELGRDWQEIQQRVDSGQSSVRDVFAGKDESPAAHRLRQVAQQTLSEMAEDSPADVREALQEEEAAADEQWRQIQRRTGNNA